MLRVIMYFVFDCNDICDDAHWATRPDYHDKNYIDHDHDDASIDSKGDVHTYVHDHHDRHDQ